MGERMLAGFAMYAEPADAIRRGMAHARLHGRFAGRPKVADKQIVAVSHLSPIEAATSLGIHVKTYKRRLKKLEMTNMLQGFALYKEPEAPVGADHNTIATPLGCRLMRIVRLYHGWRLWNSTADFKFGTYLELFDDGRVLQCTTRVDEGDEFIWIRPSDEHIRHAPKPTT